MRQKIKAEIIATGSEILLGKMVDTNSAWLSETLAAAGFNIVKHTSVGDDKEAIVGAIKQAWAERELIVLTGGLGPTEDDLSRVAACEAFGRKLIFSPDIAEQIKKIFATRSYHFTENNLRQSYFPQGSLIIDNDFGTAPGFAIEENGKIIIFLPGVPLEMKNMTKDWVLPKLRSFYPSSGFRKTLTLKCAGLGESMVDERIGELVGLSSNTSVGLLASPDLVRIIVSVEGENEDEVNERLNPLVKEISKRLDGHIFTLDNDESLYQVIAALLKKSSLRLTVLDALTQGRLTGLLVPELDKENWSGAQDLPWQRTVAGVQEILRLYAPDILDYPSQGPERILRRGADEIRLVLTCRPDGDKADENPCLLCENPSSFDEGLNYIIESGLHNPLLNHGQPIIKHFNVGPLSGRALRRAAALSAFHLWQTLKENFT